MDTETVQIIYYESGNAPTGSVAVLKDGRFILTNLAYDMLRAKAENWDKYQEKKKLRGLHGLGRTNKKD